MSRISARAVYSPRSIMYVKRGVKLEARVPSLNKSSNDRVDLMGSAQARGCRSQQRCTVVDGRLGRNSLVSNLNLCLGKLGTKKGQVIKFRCAQ